MAAQIIENARRVYLAEFSKRALNRSKFHLEPALRNETGGAAVEGLLQLPLRVDLIDKLDGSSSTVKSPGPRIAERTSLLVDGVHVTIESPVWDDLSLRLVGCTTTDFSALRQWFGVWFDEEDRNSLNDEGFYGVVHFLSDPETHAGATSFRVDLGSAPLKAFDQLLECLAAYHPNHIEVGFR
jgi:hypothetical protein